MRLPVVECEHRTSDGCRLGFYGGRPSPGTCVVQCIPNGRNGAGLGDRVAKTIHTVTRGRVKPCGGCKKRQATLNRLAPATRRA